MATTIVTHAAPTPGTLIAAAAPVYVDAFTATGTFARVVVTVVYPGLGVQEVAYDGAEFTAPYAAHSSVAPTVDGTYGTGLHFVLRRGEAWPDGPRLVVYAIDSAGLLATVTPFAWLVAQPGAVDPPAPGPAFPPGAGPGAPGSGIVAHDAAYMRGVVDRVLSVDYLDPIKHSPAGGYEAFRGLAAIGARVSTAVARLESGSFAIFADGGGYAEGVVEFYRTTADAGAVVAAPGSVVGTSAGGRQFVTLDPAAFGPLDLGPVAVRVRAEAKGWEWNVPGERITAGGEVLPGEIDTCTRLLQERNPIHVSGQHSGAVAIPANTGTARYLLVTTTGVHAAIGEVLYDDGSSTGTMTVLPALDGRTIFTDAWLVGGTISLLVSLGYRWDGLALAWAYLADPRGTTFVDATLRVQQIADTTGGAPPALDGLGEDRGVPRVAGERDVLYRYRIRQLPDTVSPAAIRRAVASVLDPLNVTAQIIETPSIAYQTCYDAPATPLARNPDFDPDLFCFDDPRPATPFRNRWLDAREDRGAGIVVVPALACIADAGLAYDDTATTMGDLDTALGRRAVNAYDVPATFTAGLQGAYDGGDPPRTAVYVSLWRKLQALKAAGVAVIIELEGQ